MLKNIFTVMLCLIASLYSHTLLANHSVEINDAWISDAPPSAKIRAGYLTMHNPGEHEIVIKSFSSKDFARIELHKTTLKDGMMKMEEIKNLTLKSGESIEFKPGGYHLMLFSPKEKLKKADKVRISVQLSGDETTFFTATVQKRGDDLQQNHEHHHHH